MISKLFSITYLGPVEYYAHIFSADIVEIEKHCNYTKQTYRNRCTIIAANGVLPLVIPVVKSGNRCKIHDIRISYDTSWQALHWKSITSAYNSSPYFEFYKDDFRPFYEKRFDFLFDFNMELMDVVFDQLGTKPTIKLTSSYVHEVGEVIDLRDIIHPKTKHKTADQYFNPQPYRQLFSDRHGFIGNLSILDLIFNKGPESLIVLKESIQSKF